jgi:putative peptidoglycan lipid II flippase
MPEIGSVFVALWPAFLGGLIWQVSPLVDQIFASLLPTGSISALGYALKIVSVFSGIIFTSVGRAVLPYLSRQAASNNMREFKNTLRLYSWIVGLGTAVLSILMLFLAHPIVQILFQRGAFSAEDTERTATTFIGFVFGLAPMSLGFVDQRFQRNCQRCLRLHLCSILAKRGNSTVYISRILLHSVAPVYHLTPQHRRPSLVDTP